MSTLQARLPAEVCAKLVETVRQNAPPRLSPTAGARSQSIEEPPEKALQPNQAKPHMFLQASLSTYIGEIRDLQCSLESIHLTQRLPLIEGEANNMSDDLLWSGVHRHLSMFLYLFSHGLWRLLRQIFALIAGYLSALSSGSPALTLLGDNIIFEDALGRSKRLPCDFFRSWGVFESFLTDRFQEWDFPGGKHVNTGLYSLFDKESGELIQSDRWKSVVRPRKKIVMSMILRSVAIESGSCPRCGSIEPATVRPNAQICW